MTMQTRTYTCFSYAAAGGLNWETADLRVLLFMTNSTVAEEDENIEFLDDFTTLDEFDGANYARKALNNQTRTKDFTNIRTICDADDLTFTALGAGTRDVAGALVYVEGASDTARIPVAALLYATPRTPDSSDFLLAFPTTGIVIYQAGPNA
ncbi:MAG: hypothetical protein GX616_12425 [Planctomycetes bacterium]|nr:hypothetical protein [Planctomycetota bacterium]